MTCADCAGRFYDLGRVPAVCPKCGVEQKPVAVRSPYSNRVATTRWQTRAATFVHIEPDSLNAVADIGIDDPDVADPPEDDDDEADVVPEPVEEV
jgi:hypothetical protein